MKINRQAGTRRAFAAMYLLISPIVYTIGLFTVI